RAPGPRDAGGTLNGEHAAALLFLLRPAAVEDDAVAGLERSFQGQENFIARDAGHLTEIHAAFFAEAGVDQFLVVRAAEPAGGKAARESHLHFVLRIADCGWRVGGTF